MTVTAAEESEDFSATLRAPILISNGIGHQFIDEAEVAPVRARLFADMAKTMASMKPQAGTASSAKAATQANGKGATQAGQATADKGAGKAKAGKAASR